MKSIISLAIFFVIVCSTQALSTHLEVTVQYEGFDVLRGRFLCKMVGNNQSHEFTLKPWLTSNRDIMKYEYNFPGYVQSISFTWQSKYPTPIEIKPLIVSWPTFGEGLVNNVFLSDKKQLKNGETAIFTQA